MVLPKAKISSVIMTPNGSLLWIYAEDVATSSPQAVTSADLSLSTITSSRWNSGNPISLAGTYPIYDANLNVCWVFVGQPAQNIFIGDTDAGCVKTGAWAESADTEQSSLFQNFASDWESHYPGPNQGKGTIAYNTMATSGNASTQKAVYTISGLVVGDTYNLYNNSWDVYYNNPQGNQIPPSITDSTAFTTSTLPTYAIYNGSTTANYSIDQTTPGSLNRYLSVLPLERH